MTQHERVTPTVQPRCIQCVHHYITHDEIFRYGCRSLDFKSAREPARDVLEASGEPCHFFLAKKPCQAR